MRHALRVLAILALFCVGARADTVECYSFFADPSTYYGPPGVIVVNGNSATFTYSFVVTTTYVNNCSESRWIGGGFGTDEDPMLADAPWAPGSKMDGFFDPSYNLAPGQSISLPFAWYVWSADAPVGYTWTANINAEGWGSSQFTAVVSEPVPEPGTLALLGTGLVAVVARVRKKRL